MALPGRDEEIEPSFAHYEETVLPILQAEGKHVRLVVGHAWGLHSPVKTLSDTIYAAVVLDPGAVLPLDAGDEERGIHVVSGTVDLAGEVHRRW